MKISRLKELSEPYPKHSIRIGEFLIPILVHIKDIPYVIKDTSVDVDLSYRVDPLEFEYNMLREIDIFRGNLKFINIEDKLFPDDAGNRLSLNFLERHNLKSLDQVMESLNIIELKKLNVHINKIIPKVIKNFDTALDEMLNLEKEPPDLKVKKSPEYESVSKTAKDYLEYPVDYIFFQMGIEYNPTPFFPENLGKCVYDWSYREIRLHLSYLSIKTRIEKVSNDIQSKVQEMISAKNK